MRQLLLAFVFIAYTGSAQAPYNKLLGNAITEWYIFNDGIPLIISHGNTQSLPSVQSTQSVPVPSYGKYTAKTDTSVLGKNYKKYYFQFASSSTSSHIGYMREDTVARKVWFLDKVTLTESLLYNFALTVGDTVYLNFPGTSGPFPKGYYQVKLINNVMTRVGVRKQFKLQLPGSDTLKCIESIGSIIHPTYLGTSYYGPGTFSGGPSVPCSYPYDLGLACKFSDSQKYYQSCTFSLTTGCFYRPDSCDYWNTCGGVKENSIVQNAAIYPNPSFNAINLSTSMNRSAMVTIEIIDVMGRFVKTVYRDNLPAGENNLNLNLEGIEQGSYFLNIKANAESARLPLLIIH
ncbi:MAG: T9SS type A sorting domain-containing protein [Bacteroidia bacterium]